ncbi:hypothetical protein EV383_3994 [Pseudonocardia sediminis]|uniref:Uncharacterized protein n=1 Tax=Pseudonocardia sediminis TaxID=1397368 RepID=A0A4Q7UYB4_PSEST|nr:SCO5389 family protein [Pseudonocardia sediminis]RZT87087.1 hypothetical protein EV383_3994 [Pseudonocardia sediminis]
MSLDVPTAVIDAAQRREMDDEQFVAVVRDSLPYAWTVVSAAAADRTDRPDAAFGEHEVPPPSEAERGQLLRALASNAIRGALERHFGVVLAFQNCHRVAAFAPAAVDSEIYREFISPRGQVLNQTPELRDC